MVLGIVPVAFIRQRFEQSFTRSMENEKLPFDSLTAWPTTFRL